MTLPLELDDIQHILLTRTPALTGRYVFLKFARAEAGRRWLQEMMATVRSAAAVDTSEAKSSWVTIAFTWNGLKALGLDDEALATFPDEFRAGMAARAEVLGDTGANAPENWVDGTSRPDLHAHCHPLRPRRRRAGALRGRARRPAQPRCPGVEVISSLELEATPPFGYAHDHFGYRDRLSQPVIEGTEDIPYAGCGGPLKAGEFILGYPDESGQPYPMPMPEVSRNGSYMAYRRLEEHVGKFREFLVGARRNAGGAGADRREADGPLAERRPADARSRQGRSGARRRPRSLQRFQLQG